jgi:formyltetrahydrofolate synthetase
VSAEQMGCAGAMTVLLKDALKPNLIQTLEGQPCFMHIGPFGNIAHGNSSIVADLVGQKIGEYLVTEAGFGSDLGMEKFMDIVCRAAGLRPSAVVIVATAKALKHHAGLEDDPRNSESENLRAIEEGAANLERHILNVKEFGLPCVVAANRFPGDTDEEVALVQRLALELGAHSAVLNEGFSKGGEGAAEMAEAVVDACEQPNSFNFMYEDSDPIATKIEKIASRIYRADGVDFSPLAQQKIDQFTRDGLTGLSICMAKTHLSLSADASLPNAPTGFRVPVRDIRPYTGAGFLTPLLGDIVQMPGLGATPAGFNVDIDENGKTVGLF